MRPAKIQIKLIKIWARFWVAEDVKFLHADNEDFDQTAPMHRLIWVYIGRIC